MSSPAAHRAGPGLFLALVLPAATAAVAFVLGFFLALLIAVTSTAAHQLGALAQSVAEGLDPPAGSRRQRGPAGADELVAHVLRQVAQQGIGTEQLLPLLQEGALRAGKLLAGPHGGERQGPLPLVEPAKHIACSHGQAYLCSSLHDFLHGNSSGRGLCMRGCGRTRPGSRGPNGGRILGSPQR